MRIANAFGLIVLSAVLLFPVLGYAASDEQIKKAIIRESVARYPGNCPCPYNSDRAGRSCGRRSAYSRAGAMQRSAIQAT